MTCEQRRNPEILSFISEGLSVGMNLAESILLGIAGLGLVGAGLWVNRSADFFLPGIGMIVLGIFWLGLMVLGLIWTPVTFK
jgi:hypothetical protein